MVISIYSNQMVKASKNKVALITGITGQDGSFLAELLLKKGYEVHGIVRRASTFNTSRINHLYKGAHNKNPHLFIHYGDLADAESIRKLIYLTKPDEIYNLGAQSHVKVSFDIPEYTSNITGLGALRILEAIKDYQEETDKKIKFYQASSSEMFGSSPPPQNENTLIAPLSPYGVAKVFAYNASRLYREAYGIFAVNGILFNHESERRGETFVTRKITRAIARIKAGLDKKLYLGNLDARRDWGYCYDNKTEILTKEGWKLFKNIDSSNYVATINKSGVLEYDKPTKVIRKKYKGQMITFQNRHLDLVVTPNHNMYVRNAKDKKYKLIQAGQVFKTINKWRFKKDVLWRGKKKNYFILPSINKYRSQRLEASKKLDIDNWLEFLGWFISEGYTGSGKKGLYRVGISQDKKKTEYRNNIRDCIISLGLKYSENKHEFIVNDKQLWSYLLQFGKAYNKHVPPFIKELPPQQIKIFLDALFKGDGNGKIDTEKNCNFYTSSKRLIDDVQELLLKCGLSGNIKKHKNRDNAYRINVISKYNTPSFRGNTNHVLKYTKYSGEIFCCTVPNHVLYVRRDGKACWSGNSPEYMEAAWMMMQQPKPDDYVIGTGETHTVREFVELAFKEAGLGDWKKYVEIDKRYYRPAEVHSLIADASKAKKMLKWQPKTKFKDLVKIMVQADIDELKK